MSSVVSINYELAFLTTKADKALHTLFRICMCNPCIDHCPEEITSSSSRQIIVLNKYLIGLTYNSPLLKLTQIKCSLSPVVGQPFALWWLLNSEFELFVCLYFPGKKVWDEVAEHSKEFIQEYLEEFPNVSKLKKKYIYSYLYQA